MPVARRCGWIDTVLCREHEANQDDAGGSQRTDRQRASVRGLAGVASMTGSGTASDPRYEVARQLIADQDESSGHDCSVCQSRVSPESGCATQERISTSISVRAINWPVRRQR